MLEIFCFFFSHSINLLIFNNLFFCLFHRQRKLEKQRAMLEKKMKEDQSEQAEIRKQEDKIVGYVQHWDRWEMLRNIVIHRKVKKTVVGLGGVV